MNQYWKNIKEGIQSSLLGLKLTFRHLLNAGKKRKPIGIDAQNYFHQSSGLVTLNYPHESLPVPDHGRYRLNNEIDDCIVCDLCAKICPVNCIEIEAIRSAEEIGKTSDGSTKRLYAGKFDIDMAKCCYCGLCTTVCPTECLTMTKTYDFSEFDIRNMVYHFTDLSPEQAEEKRRLYEESQRLKEELKRQKAAEKAEQKEGVSGNTTSELAEKPVQAKPSFKPMIKPAAKQQPKIQTPEEPENTTNTSPGTKDDPATENKPASAAPVIKKPIIKPVVKKETTGTNEGVKASAGGNTDAQPKVKNSLKPVIKKPAGTEQKPETPKDQGTEAKKPVIRPVIKPVIKPKKDENKGGDSD